jgi:hypothetical protein
MIIKVTSSLQSERPSPDVTSHDVGSSTHGLGPMCQWPTSTSGDPGVSKAANATCITSALLPILLYILADVDC